MIPLYNAQWPDELCELQIVMKCIQKGGEWKGQSGKKCGAPLSDLYKRMRKIIWPYLDDEDQGQRWHKVCRDAIIDFKVCVLMGPGSCVAGETKLVDPTTGEKTPIRKLSESGIRPMVMTLNGPRLARVPFLKGESDLIEVKLKSGKRFVSTPGHLVLTEHGFRAVESLLTGQCLISYDESQLPSNSGSSRKESLSSVRNLLGKSQDSQSDYPAYSHFCDGLPRLKEAASKGVFPLPSYVPIYSQFCESLQNCSLLEHTRPYQSPFPPSSLDAFPSGFRMGNDASLRFSLERFLRVFDWCSQLELSSSRNIHRTPFSEPIPGSFRSYLQREKPYQNYRVQADVVQEINHIGFGKYYDLQVPEDHHYFADGTIHHNSGKTHEASWSKLCEYFCFPDETCVLVSSTDIRGLKLRVWGEISKLWSEAIQQFDFLPGHMLDSKMAITTDSLEDGDFNDRQIRDFRKGIIGIPTMSNGKFVGLSKWLGIKQKRVRLVADEAQLMGSGFLSAFSNLNKNEDFRAIVLGNPNEMLDPLGKAAEPLDGWDAHMQPEKTSTWKTRFMNGICVNLIGTDSPNFDFPPNKPTRFKYLISKEKIAETLSFFPKESFEYYGQCVGSMRIGTLSRRVLTRVLCTKNHALERDVNWENVNRTKIYAVDAAYGGDRCVGGWGEFGRSVGGKVILLIHDPVIIPVTPSPDMEAEYQIAMFVKKECESSGIPPENFFYDSTGRGSLGTALARIWSAQTNPVESGGVPSERVVSLDHYINDPKTKIRRLKLCSEHYVKRVTEHWFSVRYTVEAEQLRGMPEDVMEEFSLREWNRSNNDKIEIETKSDMKERIGRSPDLADWLSILVEGARRRGFQISKLANQEEKDTPSSTWLKDRSDRHREIIRSKELTFS